MLILQPVIHETVWGTDLLSDLYDPDCRKIGHLYSCNPQKEGSNIILNGEYKGRDLYDYLVEKEKIHTDLQFVIAIVTPEENLSIQVHPSFGPHKKNESWYFMKKPNCSFIYNGCKTTDKQLVRQEMMKGNLEAVTDRLYIEDGDYVYVQAGTLHSMTAGCVVYEIEELNGETYRFYDYNRLDKNGQPRELQMEDAICHLKCESKSQKTDFLNVKTEEKYEVKIIEGGIYRNNFQNLECLTLIEGKTSNPEIKLGMSIVLEPGESFDLGAGRFVSAH